MSADPACIRRGAKAANSSANTAAMMIAISGDTSPIGTGQLPIMAEEALPIRSSDQRG